MRAELHVGLQEIAQVHFLQSLVWLWRSSSQDSPSDGWSL